MSGGSTIGVVQVVLSARDDSLAREFGKANRELAELRRGFDRVFDGIQMFAGAAGVTMAVDLFKSMREEQNQLTKAGLEFQDNLVRQAENLGISTRAMAAFAVVEGRADMAAGSLSAALAKMQQFIQSATKYGSEADKTIRALGISIADIGAATADQQFQTIADAIAKVQNAAERTALTMEIFGKSGKQLVSTMAEGGQALVTATKAAEQYGIALTKADEIRVKLANDKAKETTLIAEGMKSQVAAANAVDALAQTYIDRLDEQRKAARAKIAKDEVGFWTRTIAIYKDAIIGGETQPYAFAIKRAQTDMAEAVKVTTTIKVAGAEEAAAATEREAEAQRRQAIEMKRAQEVAASYTKTFSDMRKATTAIDDEAARQRMSAWLKDEGKLLMSTDPVRWSWTLGEFIKDKDFEKRQRDAQKVFSSTPSPAWDAENNKRILGTASADPRVKYEADVLAAIQAGKDMAAAVELARKSQEQAIAITAPGSDVRVTYEAEVQRLIGETQRQAAQVQLQNESNRQQAYLQATAQFFGDIQTITAEGAKDNAALFLANRAAAMAQAEIMAWLAYANILGQSTMYGGPLALPFAQAMATTALVAGQFAVANIAAQTIQGVNGSRANGGSVGRGGLYQVNERGPEMLTIGDKSFLMMGNRDGRVSPNGGSSPSGVTVNVHNNASGTAARVEHSGTPEAPRLDIIIEQVDRAIAAGIRSGAGSTAKAIQGTYGTNRARGAS